MAIHIGFIPAMEINNIHNITVITNSIAAASKVLKSKVNSLQNLVILSWLGKTAKSIFIFLFFFFRLLLR